MGHVQSHYQTLCCQVDAGAAAEALDRLFEELFDLGVLEDRTTARSPDGQPGYPPGPHWEAAIVECDETFLELEHNAVIGSARRRVVDPGEFEFVALCPECLEPRDFDSDWEASARSWLRGEGSAGLECPACGHRTSVEDWAYDPPLGFANLSVTFWNWPSINREFINRVQRSVGTHLALIEGSGTTISNLVEAAEDDALTVP